MTLMIYEHKIATATRIGSLMAMAMRHMNKV